MGKAFAGMEGEEKAFAGMENVKKALAGMEGVETASFESVSWLHED